MQTLLNRCLDDDDPDAWGELWLLFWDVALSPVRSLLRRCGFPEQDAEDVVMEIASDLFGHEQHKLRSFRGTTKGQLCCWFAKVATNHARNWIGRRIRTLRREQQMRREYQPAQREGITESELEFILKDLESLTGALASGVKRRDFQRLRVLAGLETSSPSVVPDRTLRHWRQTLTDQCRTLLHEADSD